MVDPSVDNYWADGVRDHDCVVVDCCNSLDECVLRKSALKRVPNPEKCPTHTAMPREKIVPIANVPLNGVCSFAAVGCNKHKGDRFALRRGGSSLEVRIAQRRRYNRAVSLRPVRDCIDGLPANNDGENLPTRE